MPSDTVSSAAVSGYDGAMTRALASAVPRPLLYVGLPALAGLLGVALWAWARFGQGVFFDTLVGGMSACL